MPISFRRPPYVEYRSHYSRRSPEDRDEEEVSKSLLPCRQKAYERHKNIGRGKSEASRNRPRSERRPGQRQSQHNVQNADSKKRYMPETEHSPAKRAVPA